MGDDVNDDRHVPLVEALAKAGRALEVHEHGRSLVITEFGVVRTGTPDKDDHHVLINVLGRFPFNPRQSYQIILAIGLEDAAVLADDLLKAVNATPDQFLRIDPHEPGAN